MCRLKDVVFWTKDKRQKGGERSFYRNVNSEKPCTTIGLSESANKKTKIPHTKARALLQISLDII